MRPSSPSHQEPRLTPRQRQILQLILHAIASNGAPPTRAEIATEFGFRSPNAAEAHLRALARKGMIDLVSATSRGIRVRGAATRALGLAAPARTRAAATLVLPLVGRVAAGAPILAEQHLEGTYTVEPALFGQQPDYLLRVRGSSMVGAGILNGDLLAVRRAQTAEPGTIVVARLDDEVTVKRFIPEAGRIRLHAENPDFEDILVRPGEPFAIEGLAVGLVRSHLALTAGSS